MIFGLVIRPDGGLDERLEPVTETWLARLLGGDYDWLLLDDHAHAYLSWEHQRFDPNPFASQLLSIAPWFTEGWVGGLAVICGAVNGDGITDGFDHPLSERWQERIRELVGAPVEL